MLESFINHYCVFFRDNDIEYGWIEGIQKNKLIIVPLSGKKQFIAHNRIALIWKDDRSIVDTNTARKYIIDQSKNAVKFKDSCELETMHSLLREIKEYSLEELAVYFLTHPEDPISKLGLFLAMREDSYWFKHNRNLTYTPRTEKELEIIKVQLSRQKEIKDRGLNIKKWIHEIENNNWDINSSSSVEQRQWFEKLLDILVDGTNSKYWKEISSYLEWGPSIGIQEEKIIKRWLKKAGSPVSHSRLTLLRADVRERFSDEIHKEVAHIQKIPLKEIKIFSPKIPTYTIDSENTCDYDDAFSIMEWSKSSIVLAAHITDLSDLVHPNSLLFKEAEARISSVYSLESSIPMIPDELSNGTFSLKEGEDRNVISYIFQLSESGNWDLLKIEPHKIRVHENLNYNEADYLIKQGRDFWQLLHKFCQRSLENRLEKGALNFVRKEFYFDINDTKNIIIKAINRERPSSRVIEEIAISVNSITGRMFQQESYPAIYRTQSSYEIIKDVKAGTELTLDNVKIDPAKLSPNPGKHAGLGCEFYIQTTSPIRRFGDLVIQHNLKLLISKKKPLFKGEDMTRWAELISVRQRKYSRAEREITKFWKLKYLEQNLGEIFKVKVSKKLGSNNTEIDIVELDLLVSAEGLKEYEVGEKLLLRIDNVSLEPPKVIAKNLLMRSDEELHKIHEIN